MATGTIHSCALKTDGSIQCWGIDDGSSFDNGQVASAPTGPGFSHVSLGGWNSCALTGNGRIECWGDTWVADGTPIFEDFVQLDVGQYQACGIRNSGEMVCWPESDAAESYDLDQVPSGSFSRIRAGITNNCAIDTDEALQCWGEDDEFLVTDTPR